MVLVSCGYVSKSLPAHTTHTHTHTHSEIDDLLDSQDQKLQQVKLMLFNYTAAPAKLCADQPVLLSVIAEVPEPALVSTHFNDCNQSPIEGGHHKTFSACDVDFSRAEDFFQLETPIDARRDHNQIKLAYSIPNKTFMSRILHRYPINKKRLAYIQRRPHHQNKLLDMSGQVLGGAKRCTDGKEVMVSCNVCGQRFNRQHLFQRHILTHIDPESKKFLCQVCGKRFNRADHLNRHSVLHGDVLVHKCLLCGEEFDRASHLDRHRRKHHPPAGQAPSQTPPLTPRRCHSPPPPLPPASASKEGSLSDSSAIQGNLHLLAAVATPEGSITVMPENFQVVAMETELVEEEQVEAEPERPFPCKECGRKFIRATHLRRHMRIHTGEKPFACHICGRRYARGDYLRAHIHAHRRDKVHKCKHCGEVFHDLTRFADHCRVQHRDLDDEHGNPRPPPSETPPLPSSIITEDPIELESAEISLVPSSGDCMGGEGTITVTYITEPEHEQAQEVVVSSLHQQQHPAHGSAHMAELSLAQLQSLASQTDLLANGQLPVVPETGSEVTVLSQPKVHMYSDPVAQYIVSNGNSGATPTIIFPTSTDSMHYTQH